MGREFKIFKMILPRHPLAMAGPTEDRRFPHT